LFKFKKNIIVINNKPNGKNINLKCGSLHPEKLQKKLIKKRYDFGLALDGDSDRCVLISRKYGLIQSEKTIFIFLEMLDIDTLNKLVCTSEIVNKALESNLSINKYILYQTKVGDRNVINISKKKKAKIGFEPSGHFYFPKLNNSMDGNLSIILILNYFMQKSNNFKNINELDHYNRIVENIPKSSVDISLKTIKKRILKLKTTKNEKLIIRQSIWDPIYRLYYDYKKKNRFEKIRKVVI
ncbi:hypothetical protein OA530_04535, partial [Pelagibacteraceae bacterium]|nr:hypothetical protein [Pelagibacteraceae bacterium]